jgi:molecular chaperone GrpE
MNDRESQVEDILDRFREWLSTASVESEARTDHRPGRGLTGEAASPSREFGLVDLVEEFTALRQELKLQTKSGRSLVEQTDATVAALRQAVDQFRAAESRLAQAAWTTGKTLAEALADLDEALDRGHREIERARTRIATEPVRALEESLTSLFRGRSWFRRQLIRAYHNDVLQEVHRGGLARADMFDSLLEGYGLIQKRLRRVMAAEQIERIKCEGTPVDPELMNVIDVVDDPRYPPGTVVKELRRGYTWKGRLIRYAEVQAARGTTQNSLNGRENTGARAEGQDDQDEVEVETNATIGRVELDSD